RTTVAGDSVRSVRSDDPGDHLHDAEADIEHGECDHQLEVPRCLVVARLLHFLWCGDLQSARWALAGDRHRVRAPELGAVLAERHDDRAEADQTGGTPWRRSLKLRS